MLDKNPKTKKIYEQKCLHFIKINYSPWNTLLFTYLKTGTHYQ